ncbi:hypothetical protein BRD17_06520, partial [Halobacteriales archaeon SW_7_68_16]
SVGVASLWLVVVTAVCTLPVGLAANWVVAGYDLSGNARMGLGAVVLAVFYVVLFARSVIADRLAATPLSWAGDLVLATVPNGGGDPVLAGGFAVASLAAVALAGLACVRLAEEVWYGDPAFLDDDDDAERALPAFGRPTLRAVCGPRTAALVAVTWRRTRRTPKVLFYVYPAAFVGVVMAEQLVVVGPFSPALYPAVVGLAGATAVGSGFTLNPLGTEGDALPALLSTGTGSVRFVRAKALAAAIPGGIVVLGLAVGLGASARVPALVLASALVYATAMVALAGLLSQALGVHYPPDHGGLLGGSVKVPDKSASALYSVGMLTVGMPGFAGVAQYALTGTLVVPVLVGGVAITVVVALGIAALSYRHAVSRLDAYSVE